MEAKLCGDAKHVTYDELAATKKECTQIQYNAGNQLQPLMLLQSKC